MFRALGLAMCAPGAVRGHGRAHCSSCFLCVCRLLRMGGLVVARALPYTPSVPAASLGPLGSLT
eukprot:3769547-Alexandrium_andersonii.AAC.1